MQQSDIVSRCGIMLFKKPRGGNTGNSTKSTAEVKSED